MKGYDIVGDVHGHADRLTELFAAMEYVEIDGVWRHAERTSVFVGDLVDREPSQLDTVTIVRAMVDAGAALITVGNHEFNAVATRPPASTSVRATAARRSHIDGPARPR